MISSLSSEDAAATAGLKVPIPENEAERLYTLREAQLLNTKRSDPAFDRFSTLTKRLFGVPSCSINLVEADRVLAKSTAGLEFKETPRDASFCTYTILPDSPDVFVVEDAESDDRFANFPTVKGPPFVRFYAGAALTINNVKIGTLCIVGQEPRVGSFSTEDRMNLLDIGAAVSDLIRERYDALQSMQKDTAKIVLGMMSNLRAPVSKMTTASTSLLTQPEVTALSDAEYLKKNLLGSVSHLELLVESSVSLGQIVVDKAESESYGYKLCDILTSVKEAIKILENLESAPWVNWHIDSSKFEEAHVHICSPKVIYFLLLSAIERLIATWSSVSVDISFQQDGEDFEYTTVMQVIDNLPPLVDTSKWCQGLVSIKFALADKVGEDDMVPDSAASAAAFYSLEQVVADVGGEVVSSGIGGMSAGSGAGCSGEGTFECRIPCALLQDSSVPTATTDAGPRLTIPSVLLADVSARKLLRVLVVEDNHTLSHLLSRYLRREGCAVTTAVNGKEGLELLQSQEFDICFIDFLMV
jgi:CheY-like chemotaxis protein